MIGAFQSANAAVAARERVAERFVTGDGLGWHEHHHGLFHGVERAFAAGYRAYLVAEWLPALDGVVERLEAGGSAADVGCGHGISTILMAQAFPAARFVGIDYHAESIATARERAAEAGVADRVSSRSRARTRSRAPATTSSRSSTRSTTSATRSRRPAAPRRCSRRTAAACWSSRSRATGWRTTCNPIGRFYYGDVDARVHARVAVAARPRRARHPGRRGAPAPRCCRRAGSARCAAPPRRR